MEQNLIQWAIAQAPATTIALAVLWFQRKDRLAEKQDERADRKEEQAAYHKSITEITTAYKESIAELVEKFEVSETRFQGLLEQAISGKGDIE